MTVFWSQYAQSLTQRPMKAMLTGPVTILNWSFVRDDQPRSETCLQIAFAIRDEVLDLEKAGLKVIQIDEPALREGLPLKKAQWQPYLDWAVFAFRVSANGVANDTQIHTHMCYSEFRPDIRTTVPTPMSSARSTVRCTSSSILPPMTGWSWLPLMLRALTCSPRSLDRKSVV